MLDDIKLWIVSILIGAFIVNIVDIILPNSKIKPYVNLVVNFIFVFIIVTPIVGFFSKGMSLEDSILKHMNGYNKDYFNSTKELSTKTGKESLAGNYEESLKEVLKLKLEEKGYELENIDFNGSDINNIKIKEKNSNNDKEKDIQSSNKEKTKQTFKNKEENDHELNLSKDKLKDDLVKILDVSIENIKID